MTTRKKADDKAEQKSDSATESQEAPKDQDVPQEVVGEGSQREEGGEDYPRAATV